MAVSISADGSSPTGGIPVEKGTYVLCVAGTFGGGTVTPQQQIDGTNWTTFTKSDGTALSYTGSQVFVIDLGKCKIQYVMSGSTNPVVTATGKPISTVGSGGNF